MPKVKIKRKGLPKYQQRPGTFQVEPSPFALPDFLNNVTQGVDWHTWNNWVNQGSTQPVNVNTNTGGPLAMNSGSLNAGLDWNNEVQAGQQQIPANPYSGYPNNIPVDPNQSVPFGTEAPYDVKPIKQQKKKTGRGLNPLGASIATSILGRTADLLTRNQDEQSAMEAAKKQGMSDAAYGSMRNVYSRGRTPEGYAYNMMVPIQFAGAPAPEMYGQPQIRRAKEGLDITRDVLGLPDLVPVSEPSMNIPNEEIPINTYRSENPPISTTEQLHANTNRVLNLPSTTGGTQVSLTHNNPLNLHYGKFAIQYGGSKGSDDAGGNVAIFPDLQTGLKANTDLLFGKAYNNLTISQARNKWVSGNPGTPNSSTNDIVKSMGKDVPLNQLTPPEKDKLFKLFAKWEGKQAYNLIKDVKIFRQGGENIQANNDINDTDMTHKVRITKVPELKAGGAMHLGDQQNYGLYRGGGYLQDYLTGTEVPDEKDIRSMYPEEPTEATANVEVEKGELIKDSQGLYKVGGKKHSEGGTKANVEEGAYVFSDYIKMNPMLSQAFNFKSASNKKKDNTVAKLLTKKVDSQDYNRLKNIISSAEAGKEVDPLELKTAQNRMADYDKYISRAALAGELSKAMEGKPFQIPEIGLPALEELGMQTRDNKVSEQPMTEAKYGMQYMAYGAEVVDVDGGDPIKRKEVAKFLKENPDYKQDPKNPNRLYKEGTAGISKKIDFTVTTPGGRVGVKKAIPGGSFNKQWENWLISQLQKGVTIDDLVSQGHGTRQGLEKYKNYYIPVKPYEEKIQKEIKLPGTPPDERLIIDEQQPVTPQTNVPVNPNFNYGRQRSPRPYLQDALNLADVASRYYTDVPPTRISTSPAYIDPAFVQPNYFPIQSQAAQASRDAALYGRGAQGQSAVLQNIQAGALPAMGQLQTGINAQNVATDMGTRQFNAGVYNQNQAQNAGMRKQYADEVAQYIWNKDTSRIQKNTAAKNAINQGITNWGNTKLMNQRFPQMAFDPLSYDVFYKPGSGRTSQEAIYSNYGSAYGDTSQWNSIYQKEYDKLSNVKDEKIRAAKAAKNADVQSGMLQGNGKQAQMQQMQMMQQMGYGSYTNPYYNNQMNSYVDPFSYDDPNAYGS